MFSASCANVELANLFRLPHKKGNADMVKTYQGYFTEGMELLTDGEVIRLPSRRWVIVNVLEDGTAADKGTTATVSTITFEMEETLYHEAMKVLKEIGMDMTCAINLFLRAVI